ncbi:uroporphyrinogen-III synthase [Alicycliphilus denitrificans]|uniref:uroporphyrinogen-III synthase n=1 Tax=Alicycliphilus denitrificans TaxID=179636 RepID=UPI0001DA01E6|nr:uroporphyrinogen-III synthase [Alicycliphilus denitrificans]ADV00543.1 uroporphyrinogen-III synthase [Alicycliphilus denitrificans BC]
MLSVAAPPRAIVTRPAREAAQWVTDLQAHGIAAAALPLIAIGAVADPALREALQRARARLGSYRAVMFVSGNAVQYFFEENQAPGLSQKALAAINTRVWAPGPGTVAALRQTGLPASRIDAPGADAAQFDSEALWQVVAPQISPGDRVLVVRGSSAPAAEGGNGREWLAGQIGAAGGAVDFVAAYERRAPRLDAAGQALARTAAGDGSLWLLSSSEAVTHLAAALPGQDWSRARALATHPRIAQAARAAGFGTVLECRPSFAEVVASIESPHEQ